MQVKELGLCDYETIWQEMRSFTQKRDVDTEDELWLLEHYPVFTQGLAGKAEHVLHPLPYPLVHSDRGGQITYHAPGQAIVYALIDLRRAQIGARQMVSILESSVIDLLAERGVSAYARKDAPGVYVDGKKIASLGMRVHRGCCYHGIALNVDMDLAPFDAINPCGLSGMRMTQLSDLLASDDVECLQIRAKLAGIVAAQVLEAEQLLAIR